jgi:hypothetical protein
MGDAWKDGYANLSAPGGRGGMSLKMFEFTVLNTRTKEATTFLGQGESMGDAWKDGYANLSAPFRFRQDNQPHPPIPLTVTLPDGKRVERELKAFEGDAGYVPKKEGVSA